LKPDSQKYGQCIDRPKDAPSELILGISVIECT
jgi:hypothetical protein